MSGGPGLGSDIAMKRSIVAVTALNLILRSAWVLNVHPEPRSDFAFYFGAAARLAEGQGYTLNGEPTAYWPLGWPLVLGGLFRIFGSQLWVGLAFQIAATTAIAVLILVLTNRVSGSLGAGIAAAVVWTLLPGELGWTSVLGTEPLFTLLTLGALCALAFGTDSKRLVVAGVLLGAACWVRPTVVLFPVAFAIVLMIHHRSWLVGISKAAVVLAIMLAVIAPLTIRNSIQLGAFVPFSTNGGVNLWQGIHTDSGYWWPADPRENPLAAANSEIERDRLGQRLFVSYAVAHPLDLARHGVAKIISLYGPPTTVWLFVDGGWSHRRLAIITSGAAIAYWAFMLAAVVGAFIGWRQQRWATKLLLGFIIYYSIVWSVFPAWDRFRYPLMPVFAVFAGIAIVRLWAFARREARPEPMLDPESQA